LLIFAYQGPEIHLTLYLLMTNCAWSRPLAASASAASKMRSPIRVRGQDTTLHDPSLLKGRGAFHSLVIPAKAGIQATAGNRISMIFAAVPTVKR
jgi:hypothetical protein